MTMPESWARRVEAAEARATELERERDKALSENESCWKHCLAERERAERAETALREIDALDVDWTQGVDENAERLKDIARAALGETAPSELPSHCVATSERTIAADGNPFRCAVCDNILVRHDGKLEIAALGETAPPAADPRLISYVNGRHRGKKAP